MKSISGRGFQRFPWVEELQSDLREELDSLPKLGVKFNLNTLRWLALQVLRTSDNTAYSSNIIDLRTKKPLHENFDSRWVQSFTKQFGIVCRAHTGNYCMSGQKEHKIKIDAALYLENLQFILYSGVVD